MESLPNMLYNQKIMPEKKSAKEELIEAPTRIELRRIEEPTEAITDIVAELSATSATLGKALHPRTAANLADVVRMMNTYYSNLIEGHNTRPKDIERARGKIRRRRTAAEPADRGRRACARSRRSRPHGCRKPAAGTGFDRLHFVAAPRVLSRRAR
jgi:hypothetical protein